ncbi:glycoside hydrolase family 66 protein [Carboxylicivirga caseinilyticus]|uniref:glycoside hydrolase family 66 protein n=1 Tax=Carboxylicivirga caseinilyticus TaxID=3417572 RepID=UPI003D32E382|nr:glycoside hydrolase family 66 protein [Marinilabiliaceae bacterium A049]
MRGLKNILVITLVLLVGCKDNESVQGGNVPEVPSNPEMPAYSNVFISTDKAAYAPGDKVLFTIEGSSLPAGAMVRYKHLNDVIREETISGVNWEWSTPTNDFKGYVAEVFSFEGDQETILATIGIDVSSDWTKFPRYGFLSDYGIKSDAEIQSVIDNLQRHHINGLQFYDWHNKHHKPLPIVNGKPASQWKDIINKDVYLSTVESYIDAAHAANMKAMFYNLIFGAWDDAEADGVGKEWFVYKDNTHSNRDFHPLGAPFLSNLYLLDPSNPLWQAYIAVENDVVYQNLAFDGYHMDQLGDRGDTYKYDGSRLYLNQSYQSFIEAMKQAAPEKDVVMNAVSQYGQQNIAQASPDFLYTEVWTWSYKSYNDLAGIIKQNNVYSNYKKNTVLAAYMNYDLADNKGYFNTPAVLMTNAVIFAHGGAHLELGEHMLGKEYFPNSNLAMRPDLKSAMVEYYDFLVGYENVLRDGGEFNTVDVTSIDGKLPVSKVVGTTGTVSVIGREFEGSQIIHFINFKDANSSEWRDDTGSQSVPGLISDAKVSVAVENTVSKIWVASPDIIGGASWELNFNQGNGVVTFTLPRLKYWSMVVIEY